MAEFELALLDRGDADQILVMERRAFVPPMQIGEAALWHRFDLGHTMIGLREHGQLVAMISFSLARFSPDDFAAFPKSFQAFSTLPVPINPNAMFIYNLEVATHGRGRGIVYLLFREAFALGKQLGCTYAVGDGRISAYRGSSRHQQEKVDPKPELKRAIDRYLSGGPFPSKQEFLLDPTLALYHRLTDCQFLWIIPNFASEDTAAGGIRVIVYGELAGWHPRSAKEPNLTTPSLELLAHTPR